MSFCTRARHSQWRRVFMIVRSEEHDAPLEWRAPAMVWSWLQRHSWPCRGSTPGRRGCRAQEGSIPRIRIDFRMITACSSGKSR